MKNLFLTGATAIVLGGYLAGCTHDDYGYSSIVESKKQAYQEVFVDTYGSIDPNQNWGFTFNTDSTGSSDAALTRSMMRAQMPTAPTFRDTNPMARPTMPDVTDTVPAGAKYARDYQNYQSGDVIYINTAYATLNNPQNTENLTIYVDGNVTYDGSTNQNGNGTKICVTQNSTLVLKQVSNNLSVYLAPGATLDLTQVSGTATFQNSHAALYISSNATVNAGNLQFTNSTQILNAGGTITATNLTLDQSNTLWNEGTITVTNSLSCSNTSDMIYNAANKTITAKRLFLKNNYNLLYNNGTVEATDSIALQNSSAEIVNNGTLKSALLSMRAGGKMHNVGTTTITGKTDLTNSNSQWTNDGQYTSGSFDVDNYSAHNYNNCYLKVNGNFHLNRGEFVLNAGASVVCASFTWEDTSNFWMNSSSLLRVTGNLHTNNANSDYGFRGVGESYAVIQAQAVTIDSNEQFRMSYFGNLYVDAGSHFGQWYKDAPGNNTQQPAYYYDNTVKFSFSDPADTNVTATQAPVTIPASGCSPGYGSLDETTIPVDQSDTSDDMITVVTTKEYFETTELIEQGRVFCEDLGQISSNDLDFNDVVFDAYVYRVTPSTHTVVKEDGVVVTNTTVDGTPTYKTEIVLLAAGGTLQLSLAGVEVHNKLGGNSYTTIINTIGTGDNAYGNTSATNDPVVLGTDFGYSSIVSIPIRVLYGNGETLELTAAQGWAPHKILVPIGTKWCKERVNIANAYTDFRSYVGTSQKFWEGEKVDSMLYSHPKDTYAERSMAPVTVLVGIEGPTTTYRNKGTSTTTGGYQGEDVLSRQLR